MHVCARVSCTNNKPSEGSEWTCTPPPRAVPSVSVWPKECAGQGSWYLWACSATRAPMSALVLGALLPQMTLPSGQDSGRVLPASPYPYPGSEYDPPHFSPW